MDKLAERVLDLLDKGRIGVFLLIAGILVAVLAAASGYGEVRLDSIGRVALGLLGLALIIGGVLIEQVVLRRKVKEQQVIINKLVEQSTSEEAFRHLAGITVLHEYKYWQNEKVGDLFQRQFYFLKDRGLIGPLTLVFSKELDGTNIVGRVIPTEIGRMYVKLRKDDIPKDWLSTDLEKRSNLKIDVARELGLLDS